MGNQPITFRCRCGGTFTMTMAQIFYVGAERCHSIPCQTNALLALALSGKQITVDDLEDAQAKGQVTE